MTYTLVILIVIAAAIVAIMSELPLLREKRKLDEGRKELHSALNELDVTLNREKNKRIDKLKKLQIFHLSHSTPLELATGMTIEFNPYKEGYYIGPSLVKKYQSKRLMKETSLASTIKIHNTLNERSIDRSVYSKDREIMRPEMSFYGNLNLLMSHN